MDHQRNPKPGDLVKRAPAPEGAGTDEVRTQGGQGGKKISVLDPPRGSALRNPNTEVFHRARRRTRRMSNPVPERMPRERARQPRGGAGRKKLKSSDPHRPAPSILVFLCAEVPAGTSPVERAKVAHWNCFLLCTAPINVGERTERMKGTTSKAAHDKRRERKPKDPRQGPRGDFILSARGL